MTKTFVTGVPGFIGSRLARRLLEDPARRLVCLVYPQPALLDKARALAGELDNGGGRMEIVPGDIGKPRFGLDAPTWDRLRAECTEAWHLAALYNLAAPKDLSYEVNVEGTRHVLAFCEGIPDFRKLVYFSTIVVSGDRPGTIYEHELEMGQSFRNYYEETKFLAEREVRLRPDVRSVVIRPAVVIGDSRSGEIDKYDGPYYVIAQLVKLEREKKLGLRSRILGLGEGPALFHIIPVDYLLNATLAIAADPASIGKTFQIIDPNELTVNQFRTLVFKRFGVPDLPVNLPVRALRPFLRLPGMMSLAPVPAQIFDYFDLDNRYDFRNTREVISRAGVECPPIPSFMDTLIAFVRSHPEIRVQLAPK